MAIVASAKPRRAITISRGARPVFRLGSGQVQKPNRQSTIPVFAKLPNQDPPEPQFNLLFYFLHSHLHLLLHFPYSFFLSLQYYQSISSYSYKILRTRTDCAFLSSHTQGKARARASQESTRAHVSTVISPCYRALIFGFEAVRFKSGRKAMNLTRQKAFRDPEKFPTAQLFLPGAFSPFSFLPLVNTSHDRRRTIIET